MIHEIGHVLGLGHEHNRPDRDQYVSILWHNVVQGGACGTLTTEKCRAQYAKASADDWNVAGLPYNYHSIMHYGSNPRKCWDFWRGNYDCHPHMHGPPGIGRRTGGFGHIDAAHIRDILKCNRPGGRGEIQREETAMQE